MSERALRRRTLVPALCYPPSLPVSAHIDEFCRAIDAHPVVIVCGETGSGKTTQLPKACLQAGRGLSGMIGHTQPRRIAVRSVAARLAEELQVGMGAQVGFKIRFEETGSDDTLIRVMTDGILLAEIQGDPQLRRYDTIIIDEAHERSLNIDFLLGYLKRLLPRRPDLRLVITSATIDPGKFAAFFGNAPIIEVSGRSFPIELRYRPPAADQDDDLDPGLVAGVSVAVDELLAEPPLRRGDLLVFLPGEREIREATEQLRGRIGPGVDILPLYSRLSWPEQQRVFAAGPRPRIVLATNVAETSITVPGIRAVIDTGLARIARYSPRSKILRLPIEPISRASADQRKGRCGRIGAGICIRLYAESDYESREAQTPPEILRTNLARVILQMEALGLGDIAEFPFLDRPDTRLVKDGYRLLHELEALDDHWRLTALGRTLARLPVDPRLARVLVAGQRLGALSETLTLAALLSIQDPRERPAGMQSQADEKHRLFAAPRSDFSGLLALWRAWCEVRGVQGPGPARRWCRNHFLSAARMREWADLRGQLAQLAVELGWRENETPATFEAIHRALLPGMLGGIGERTERGDYLGVRGLRFTIAPGTPLCARPPRWVMAGAITETRRVHARWVAAVKPGWIEAAARHLLRRRYDEPEWSAERGIVATRETVTLYGLTLSAGRRVNFGCIDPRAAREIFVREALVHGRSGLAAEFLAHNGRVRAALERDEARLRRHGVLFDERRVEDFFLRRIPGQVHDLRGFQRWRKGAEDSNPQLLMYSEDDVTAAGALRPDPRDFPDRLAAGGPGLALGYRFEPGAPDDGATADVPIAWLSTLDAGRLAWGVPGWRQELVATLIRGLPKTLRRMLLPAPATAAACLTEADTTAPMLAEIARCLSRRAGTIIPEQILSQVELPPFLRPNLRVLGSDGRELAQGRDLRILRRQLRQASAAALSDSTRGLVRGGIRDWDFGPLAAALELDRDGLRHVVHPALTDQGEAVALAVFEDAREAERQHRAGLCRLLEIALAEPLKPVRRALARDRELALLQQPLGTSGSVVADICERAVEKACLPAGEPLPRDRKAFERARERGRPVVYELAMGIAAAAKTTLRAANEARGMLRSLPPGVASALAADCARQLERLIGPRFIAATPDPWLAELPRLLAGLHARITKLHKGTRLAAQQELLAWHERLAQLEDCDLAAELGWLVAEYCVSLFAQPLGTSVPVSPKRLQRRFEAARVGPQR